MANEKTETEPTKAKAIPSREDGPTLLVRCPGCWDRVRLLVQPIGLCSACWTGGNVRMP
jgi:hypothetical protein